MAVTCEDANVFLTALTMVAKKSRFGAVAEDKVETREILADTTEGNTFKLDVGLVLEETGASGRAISDQHSLEFNLA